jgi:GxxExxY protein
MEKRPKKRNALQRVFGGPETPDEILEHLRREAPEFHPIVGAAMAVWDELQFGYLPTVYAQALAVELQEWGVGFVRDAPIALHYRGVALDTGHTADFVCNGDILLIVKSQPVFLPQDDAQLISQLKAAGFRRGLSLNFAPHKLDFKRVVASPGAGR